MGLGQDPSLIEWHATMQGGLILKCSVVRHLWGRFFPPTPQKAVISTTGRLENEAIHTFRALALRVTESIKLSENVYTLYILAGP